MPDVLRLALTGLVLLDVVFVHTTGAVSLHWILPLYVLTVLAPLSCRLLGHATYRWGWNLAIVAVFGVLVHDARTRGAQYLLEDGLLLAALCQVHLLNNLGERQKPDLLFFNSFLIAFVTSFFTRDLTFSVVFFLYAVWLIPSLQLYCATRATPGLGGKDLARIVRGSLPGTVLALTVTAAVFLFWPRDFQRQGWVGDDFELPNAVRDAMGFPDTVDPERSRGGAVSNVVVARIRRVGEDGPVPALWRGATYLHHGPGGWSGSGGILGSGLPEWRRRDGWLRRSREEADGPVVEVELAAPHLLLMFSPLEAAAVRVLPPADAGMVRTRPDGTLFYEGRFRRRGDPPLRYRVRLTEDPPRSRRPGLVAHRQLVAFDREQVPERLLELARELRAGLPAGAPDRRVVTAFRNHLLQREYALPGEDGAARSLEDFVAGAPGHCEYFAATLALMLRSERIPCRLVGGMLAAERDEDGSIVLRKKHAHAWVEVWDDESGWYAVDTTPRADLAPRDDLGGGWETWTDALEELWAEIATFDAGSRTAVLAWLRGAPQRFAAWCARHPAQAGTCAALLALALWWRRRRARRPAAIRGYERAVRRAGLVRAPAETPRDLLERARARGLEGRHLGLLTAATAAHERARYGSRPG